MTMIMENALSRLLIASALVFANSLTAAAQEFVPSFDPTGNWTLTFTDRAIGRTFYQENPEPQIGSEFKASSYLSPEAIDQLRAPIPLKLTYDPATRTITATDPDGLAERKFQLDPDGVAESDEPLASDSDRGPRAGRDIHFFQLHS